MNHGRAENNGHCGLRGRFDRDRGVDQAGTVKGKIFPALAFRRNDPADLRFIKKTPQLCIVPGGHLLPAFVPLSSGLSVPAPDHAAFFLGHFGIVRKEQTTGPGTGAVEAGDAGGKKSRFAT